MGAGEELGGPVKLLQELDGIMDWGEDGCGEKWTGTSNVFWKKNW